MKKRNLIRIVSFLLMIGLLLSSASAASQVQPRYQKINILTSELLSINWLGKATCGGTVTVLDETCNVELYVELQRSEDGVNSWETIKTWNTTGTEELAIEGYYYVRSGYYYRAVTCAIIYNSEGAYIESDTARSAVLYH